MPEGPFSGHPGLHAALTRNTGYLVSRSGVLAARRFAERMQSLGLSPRMWGALNVLDSEGDVTQQQLGQAIGMDPSSMVAAIDELEAQSLVERRRHPSDRRAHALHITAAGRRALQRGRKLAGEAQAELLAPLSPQEREQLHDMLLRLLRAEEERLAAEPAQREPAVKPAAASAPRRRPERR